ncbi:hypothetical protein EDD37DRAFT_649647 [Exophiala viscosa]|uniref:uncharacterized protein n=1 Tax=Exophiala viscosa TaxID=2486360 RepID=UPI00219A4621|nr:hypothetical protein EDD37DRAFT_649647 [Exophiala viscosa]
MAHSNLDHDILNNTAYLDDFDFTSDFDLYPAADNVSLANLPDLNFFPEYDFNPQSPTQPTPCSPTHRFRCKDCPESFRRRCELNRHVLKHTMPFKCTRGCGAAFAEKRRCSQHEKAAHGLATEKDRKKCHLCDYASLRPDAVKRHYKLKHGMEISFRSRGSPATTESSTGSDGGSMDSRD